MQCAGKMLLRRSGGLQSLVSVTSRQGPSALLTGIHTIDGNRHDEPSTMLNHRIGVTAASGMITSPWAMSQARSLSTSSPNLEGSSWSDKLMGDPDFVQSAVQQGDAALASSTWGNVRLVQETIESICLNFDLPWFWGIAATTAIARLCLFPVVVWTTKNNTKLMNLMPDTKIHQERLNACKERGDNAGVAAATKDLLEVYQKNGVHPLKGFAGVFFQAPVFMTMFFAMRGLADAEPAIESLKNGGALWFPDLTAADPYLILPIASVATMVLLIEVGADGAQQQAPMFKMMFRGLSVLVLGLTYNFPAAVFAYWCTNNSLSLAQTLMLKTTPVRNLLGIPIAIKHSKDVSPPKTDFSWSKMMEDAKKQMDGGDKLAMQNAEKSRLAAIEALREKRTRRTKRRKR